MESIEGRLVPVQAMEPAGAGNGYSGHHVELSFTERLVPAAAPDSATAGLGAGAPAGGEPQPSVAEALRTADANASGGFSLDLPDPADRQGPYLLEVVAPGGEVLLEQRYDALPGSFELRVDPKRPYATQPNPDPFSGRRVRLTGQVLDGGGRPPAASVQVILWARPSAPPDSPFAPVLTAQTDRLGYFSGDCPRPAIDAASGRPVPFAEAYAIVGAGRSTRVPVYLDGGAFPLRLPLVVSVPVDDQAPAQVEARASASDAPRAPDPIDLVTSPASFAADLGRCVDLTVPNRALEEFSFYSVVRTTEPAIVGGFARAASSPMPTIPTTSGDALALGGSLRAERLGISPGLARTLALASELGPALLRPPGRVVLSADNPVDWETDPYAFQAVKIAHGHLLHFKQVWRADGYSLGDLLYSLPLAPCQKKQIVVVDWHRRDTAARTEDLTLSDQLAAALSRDRDVNQIIGGMLSESQRASSSAGTSGSGFGFGLGGFVGKLGGLLGVSGGGGDSSSTAEQNSARNMTVNSLQQLRDLTLQSASSVRNLRSTVVQTVDQAETAQVESEVVANHNHCHAITVEYFEVLRHFIVTQELADVQECLFVPLLMSPFSQEKTQRWREPLRAHLRDPALDGAFDALGRVIDGTAVPGRYADDAIAFLEGELTLTLVLTRPADLENGTYNEAAWGEYGELLLPEPAISLWGLLMSLASPAERDKAFREQIAPRIAARFVDALHFGYVDESNQDKDLPLVATLVSDYQEGAPLRVSFRPTKALSPIARSRVNDFWVGPDAQVKLPVHSRALLVGGTARYRTARRSFALFTDASVYFDLYAVNDKGPNPTRKGLFDTPLSPEEQQDPGSDDQRAVNRLVTHLNEHLEHYHKAIWWEMDADRRFMLLDGFVVPAAGGRSIASVVENRLIGITGNSLVMPVARGLHLDPSYTQADPEHPVDLLQHYSPFTPLAPMRVSVPTSGVFAETVMGACNSCEEKDDNRFWRFEESPCGDEPTPIQPASTDSRSQPESGLSPTTLPQPIINLQNAPAAPDPNAAITAVLQTLGTPNLFKDITGLDQNQRNALASMQSAMSSAQAFGQEASKLAQLKLLHDSSDKTLKQIQEARGSQAITPEQANARTNEYLQALSGKGDSGTSLTDNPHVQGLIAGAQNSPDATVSIRRGDESVDVQTKGTPSAATATTPPGNPAALDGAAAGANPADVAATDQPDFTDEQAAKMSISDLAAWLPGEGEPQRIAMPGETFDSDEHATILDLRGTIQRMLDSWARNGLIEGGAMIDRGKPARALDTWNIVTPGFMDPTNPYPSVGDDSALHWHFILPDAVNDEAGARWTSDSLKAAIRNKRAVALSPGQILMLGGDFFADFADLANADARTPVSIAKGADAGQPDSREQRFANLILATLAFPDWQSSYELLQLMRFIDRDGDPSTLDTVLGATGDQLRRKATLASMPGQVKACSVYLRAAAGDRDGDPGTRYSEAHLLAQVLEPGGAIRIEDLRRVSPWLTAADEAALFLSLQSGPSSIVKDKGFSERFFSIAATNGHYFDLALGNLNHFSESNANWNAFKALHRQALAAVGGLVNGSHGDASAPIPARAIALTAFGLHYLTDSFSAGHMRVPRGALGRSGSVAAVVMHNLDGRFGLAVANGLGRRWRAFGDGFLSAPDADGQQILDALRSHNPDPTHVSADQAAGLVQVRGAAASALKQLHYEAQRLRSSLMGGSMAAVLDHNRSDPRRPDVLLGDCGDGLEDEAATLGSLTARIALGVDDRIGYMQKLVPVALPAGRLPPRSAAGDPSGPKPSLLENHAPLFEVSAGRLVIDPQGAYTVLGDWVPATELVVNPELDMGWMFDNGPTIGLAMNIAQEYTVAHYTQHLGGWIQGGEDTLLTMVAQLNKH